MTSPRLPPTIVLNALGGRSTARDGFSLLCVLCALWTPIYAQANGGVSDERVSLPDGPGSIGGAGENVSAAGNMGAMTYQLPLELPEGFPGATPDLALSYSSLNGNAELGIGWELQIPHIERSTLRGLPEYGVDDVFAANGGEELVAVLESSLTRVYRARFEGGFVRYTWHRPGNGGGGYWEAEYPDGSRAFFGADSAGNLQPNSRATSGGHDEQVFRYMLVEALDSSGHSARYHYRRTDGYPLIEHIDYLFLDRDQAEPHRDFSYEQPVDVSSNSLSRFGRVVDPLDHVDYLFLNQGQAQYRLEFRYEDRSDAISNGLPGFELILDERLAQIRVSSHDSRTGDHALLRRYDLTYEEVPAGTSRLQVMTQYGAEGGASPLTFSFQYTSSLALDCQDCSRPFVYDMGHLEAGAGGGVNFENGFSTFIDINGDALPDVLQTDEQGVHRFYYNKLTAEGTQRFAPAHLSDRKTGGLVLNEPGVQVADLNGDGFVDIFNAASGEVLCNLGDGDWAAPATECGAVGSDRHQPPFANDADPGDGNVDPQGIRFLDVDGDRRIDLLFTVPTGHDQLWRGTDAGFEPASTDDLGRAFDVGHLQLSDLNGDGLLDAVEVQNDGLVWYRLSLGRGVWTEPRIHRLQLTPGLGQLEKAELHDLNGDGRDDIVVVRDQAVHFALGTADGFLPFATLTSKDVAGELPALGEEETTILFADINASGSIDIVWICDGRVRVLELFAQRPHLLTQIDNGIGGVERVEYGTSAQEQARDEAEGLAWRYRLPQPINVVTAVERSTAVTSTLQREERRYHHGLYDGAEKRYRGFESIDEFVPGDTTQESRSRVVDYDLSDPTYLGRPSRVEIWAGADRARNLQRQLYSYESCAPDPWPDQGLTAISDPVSPKVRQVCRIQIDTELREGSPEAQWVSLRRILRYDGFGNVSLDSQLGVLGTGPNGKNGCGPCDAPGGTSSGACDLDGEVCGGDELYTETDFIAPSSASDGSWNLRSPWRIRTYGHPEGPRTETLLYYDGAAFVGLPQRELSQGLVTRVCERQRPDAVPDCQGQGWSQTTRLQYDVHGNVIASLDPLGDPDTFSGHRYSVEYADGTNLRPTAVSLYLSQDEVHYRLRREFGYHPLFGLPAWSTRWILQDVPVDSDRGQTLFDYDEFGRPAKIARPGDTLAAPTQEFEYQLAYPVSRIVERTRSTPGAEPDLESVQCVDGFGRQIQTRSRIFDGIYQADGFREFNSGGAPIHVYQSYTGGPDCDHTPPSDVAHTAYTYDALRRVLTVTEADESLYGEPSTTTMTYAPLSTTVRDPEDNDPSSPAHGTFSRRTTDGLGRVVRLERALDAKGELGRVRVLWDPLGRLAGSVDARGHAKLQSYDLLGRVTQVEDPDAGLTLFDYDPAGNLITSTDARGQVVRTRYDGANRPIETFDPRAPEATSILRRYDFSPSCDRCKNGEQQLVQVSYPFRDMPHGGHDEYSFDPRGRPRSLFRRLGDHSFETHYNYDSADRMVERQAPDGTTFVHRYDGSSRLVGVDGFIDRIDYTESGALKSLDYHNGTAVEYDYDLLQRLEQARTFASDGQTLQGFAYERDRVGNIQSVTDLADDREDRIDYRQRFSYDPWYRSTRITLAGDQELLDVEFDVRDNVTRKSSSLGAQSAAHVGNYLYAAARPHAVARAGDVSLHYDEAGRVVGQADRTFDWDYQGRLLRTQSSNHRKHEYVYGPGADRVAETLDGSTTYHVGNDFEVRDGVAFSYLRIQGHRVARVANADFAVQLFSDKNQNGHTDVGDAWGLRGESPEIRRELYATARRLLAEADGGSVFLYGDHLGSLTLATGSDGSFRGERAFYPAGGVRAHRGFVDQYGFTGQRQDPVSGWIHFQYRDLDPQSGRWTSPDPLFRQLTPAGLEVPGQSTTAYAYVAGAWTQRVDPTGLVSIHRRHAHRGRSSRPRGRPRHHGRSAAPLVPFLNGSAHGLALGIEAGGGSVGVNVGAVGATFAKGGMPTGFDVTLPIFHFISATFGFARKAHSVEVNASIQAGAGAAGAMIGSKLEFGLEFFGRGTVNASASLGANANAGIGGRGSVMQTSKQFNNLSEPAEIELVDLTPAPSRGN